jgi:hypothetical protein
MNNKYLPYLILFCALGLGITAAYYSIVGLSMLFAGVATPVIIMASFLESSKLTIATLLHNYWNKLNTLLKVYLTTALIVLSLITSAGIYGLLSAGYQTTANKSSVVDQQIASLEVKKQSYVEIKDSYLKEKESLAKSTSELRNALSKNTVLQSVDKKGNLITRESKGNRKAFENQLNSSTKIEEKLTSKLDIVNDSIFALEAKILDIKANNTLSNELGPLKYLSNLTGQPMDKIINWLLLTIIFVFDPLAIALIIAANFAFEQIRKPEPEDDLKDWDNTLLDGLEDEPEFESEPQPILEPESTEKLKEILKRPDVSGWRKNKVQQQLNGIDESMTKEY